MYKLLSYFLILPSCLLIFGCGENEDDALLSTCETAIRQHLNLTNERPDNCWEAVLLVRHEGRRLYERSPNPQCFSPGGNFFECDGTAVCPERDWDCRRRIQREREVVKSLGFVGP